MKQLKIYSFIILGFILLTTILPYKTYDKYSGGFFNSATLTQANIQESGLELPQTYILLVALLIIALITLIKENLTTSIIGFIFGTFTLLYMPLFAFSLIFSLNLGGGPRNQEIEIGFFLAAIAVLSYTILLLMNMIKHVRLYRNGKKSTSTSPSFEESDLLDDGF